VAAKKVLDELRVCLVSKFVLITSFCRVWWMVQGVAGTVPKRAYDGRGVLQALCQREHMTAEGCCRHCAKESI